MNRKLHITILLIALLGFAGCVEFKQISLYEGYEPLPPEKKPESINSLVEPVIYDDGAQDMWGLERTDCKNASLTYNHAYSGNEAVRLSWNLYEGNCEFAGIGIGWDGYAGKDLSGLMDYAAISFYVRAQEERQFGLPIVLTLEDYSGGMGFAYTDNKYFERTFIDTLWQKVEVPLADFDLETENLDPTNIKQLQLELQQSGKVFLDDIKLVFYTPQEIEPWMEEEERPDPLETPIVIFDEGFINGNGWGMVDDECLTVEISSDEVFTGSKSLHAKWDLSDDCGNLSYFGASWNKWFPVDFNGNQNDFAINLQILRKGDISEELGLSIGLQDYGGVKASSPITSSAIVGDKTMLDGGWTQVKIPLSSLLGGIDYSRIKQITFELEGEGEVYLDDIRLVRLKEN